MVRTGTTTERVIREAEAAVWTAVGRDGLGAGGARMAGGMGRVGWVEWGGGRGEGKGGAGRGGVGLRGKKREDVGDEGREEERRGGEGIGRRRGESCILGASTDAGAFPGQRWEMYISSRTSTGPCGWRVGRRA